MALMEMAAIKAETVYNPFTGIDENLWACTEFGLVVSRQNGKGSILEARELAGLFVWGERLIIHSAHLFPTAVEAFNRVLVLIESTPDFDCQVDKVVRSHGDEGIILKKPKHERITGMPQRLLFKARSSGGVRGFTADCIILDEAMMKLQAPEIEALMPTLSARPNPQVIYTGSAGDEDSEQLGRIRARAIKHIEGESIEPRMGYMEYSVELCSSECKPDCTEHPDREKPETWALANPAIGYRLGVDFIRNTEFRTMGVDSFNKERLGIGKWPVDGEAWKVISKKAYNKASNPTSKLDGEFVLVLDSATDGSYSCIAAVGKNLDGDFHVEVTGSPETGLDYRPGIKWAIPRIKDLVKKTKVPFVVVAKDNAAGAYIEELEAAGINVISPTSTEFALACGDFKNGINPSGGEAANIVHIEQGALKIAVAGAEKKIRGDLWVFDKRESGVDVTPLTCVVKGYWGYKKHVYQKVSEPWIAYS